MELTNKMPDEKSRRQNGGSIIRGGLKEYFKGDFKYEKTHIYKAVGIDPSDTYTDILYRRSTYSSSVSEQRIL